MTTRGAPQDRRARRPQTAVVAAGRTDGTHEPLNVPIVLASTFRAARGRTPSPGLGREQARDDGTGGEAVAFSSPPAPDRQWVDGWLHRCHPSYWSTLDQAAEEPR